MNRNWHQGVNDLNNIVRNKRINHYCEKDEKLFNAQFDLFDIKDMELERQRL